MSASQKSPVLHVSIEIMIWNPKSSQKERCLTFGRNRVKSSRLIASVRLYVRKTADESDCAYCALGEGGSEMTQGTFKVDILGWRQQLLNLAGFEYNGLAWCAQIQTGRKPSTLEFALPTEGSFLLDVVDLTTSYPQLKTKRINRSSSRYTIRLTHPVVKQFTILRVQQKAGRVKLITLDTSKTLGFSYMTSHFLAMAISIQLLLRAQRRLETDSVAVYSPIIKWYLVCSNGDLLRKTRDRVQTSPDVIDHVKTILLQVMRVQVLQCNPCR